MKKLTVRSQEKEVKFYTIGQIFRLGLLKNNLGQPYADKASVSKIVSMMGYVEKKTPFGMSKMIPMSKIEEHNAKWE